MLYTLGGTVTVDKSGLFEYIKQNYLNYIKKLDDDWWKIRALRKGFEFYDVMPKQRKILL